MAKGPSKARQSRVDIKITDALRGNAEPELPFRILAMGDYTQKDDGRELADREPLDINKSNFDSVMQSFNLGLDLSVKDKISGKGEMAASLKFGTLKDFRPESIARQVPQVQRLLKMRDGLKALRPSMGKKDAQKALQAAIKDEELRKQVLGMLGSAEGGEGAAPPPAAEAPAEPAADAPAPDSPAPDAPES